MVNAQCLEADLEQRKPQLAGKLELLQRKVECIYMCAKLSFLLLGFGSLTSS
jgi:hypothetical protein